MMRCCIVIAALTVGCGRSESLPNGTASCCVSSASAKPSASPSVGAASAEDAWKQLLAAMRAGDDAGIARYATIDGIKSLAAGAGTEDKHVAFARWGKGWSEWEVRWKKRDNDRAEAALGPEAKEHGLVFVRTSEGWKLDKWLPGE